MIKNYIKTALRNISKNAFFSMINIFGLAISLSVCLLIISIIKDQFDYDSTIKNRDRIYRITTETTLETREHEAYATTPASLSRQLAADYQMIDIAATLRPIISFATFQDKKLSISGAFTNKGLFDIFQFPTERGSLVNLLSTPNTVILSKETAQRLFNGDDPIGKIISLDSLGDYKVVGVLTKDYNKTHIQYDIYFSDKSINSLEKSNKLENISNSWETYFSNYTYIKVKPNTTKYLLDYQLQTFSARISKKFKFKNRELAYVFKSQKLSDITPSRALLLENSKGMSYNSILVFSGAVFLLLLLSCFNYSNLTIARALTRAKEIGIRKVVGASKAQVFLQFTIEAVIIALISLVLGCLILPFIPLDSPLQSLLKGVKIDIRIILYSILFTMVVGVTAGALPGILLSKLNPIDTLQRLLNLKFFKFSSFRKVLTVIQFTVAFVLIMAFIVLFQQTRYMANADYGFNIKDIINIKLPENINFNTLKNELDSYPQWSVSGISENFGTYPSGEVLVRASKNSQAVNLGYYYIDQKAIENFGLTIVAGTNFWEAPAINLKNKIIVNEKAVEAFNLKNSSEAIGKLISLTDTSNAEIIGVVKNFNYQNFKNPVEPLAFMYDENQLNFVNIKINESKIPALKATLRKIQNKLNLRSKIECTSFANEFIDRQSHNQEVSMIAFVTIMFLTIAGLGLLGIATYTMQIKMRDICIKKVLGATKINLAVALAKEYLILICIACFIGIPIGLNLSNAILENYVYKINIGFTNIIIPIMIVLVVGIMTFGIQTYKGVIISPIKKLARE